MLSANVIPSFIVDSADRTSGTDENFTINLQLGNYEFDSMCVSSVSIPKTYTTVNVYNNKFTFIENKFTPIATVITIPNGYYNSINMANELSALLTAASSYSIIYTVTAPDPYRDIDGMKFTFTASEANLYSIDFGSDLANSAHHLLGFAESSVNGFVQTITSTAVMNLQYTRYVNIQSDICRNVGNLDVNSSICARIGCSEFAYGSNVKYTRVDINDSYRELNSKKSNVFHFSLYDDHDRPLSSLNGNSWKIQIFLFKK